MTGLPPDDVLLDAAHVLRELADAATPGHRSREWPVVMAGGEDVGHFCTEADAALWAALGPEEARLLADLLERIPADSVDAVAAALGLAYALTGHMRPDGGTR